MSMEQFQRMIHCRISDPRYEDLVQGLRLLRELEPSAVFDSDDVKPAGPWNPWPELEAEG